MAMTVGRLEEYRTYNNQFCKRLFDYLSIVFSFQVRIFFPLHILISPFHINTFVT